jgi:hypothetical protein
MKADRNDRASPSTTRSNPGPEGQVAPGRRSLTAQLQSRSGAGEQSEGQGTDGVQFLATAPAAEPADDPCFFAPGGGMTPSTRAIDTAARIGLGDVSGARVHTDGASDAVAAAHGAHAVTFGQDIHFASGAYQPNTEYGDRLLGHELAHTAQQRGAAPTMAAKARATTPGDAFEVEADAAGESFLASLGGREVAPVNITSTHAMVARFAGPAPAVTVPATIGNQNAPDTSTEDEQTRGRQAAEGARQRDAGRAGQEKPALTIRPGGGPPGFVTTANEPGQMVQGPSPDNPHNVVVDYSPRLFHVVPAIRHDVPLVTTTDELLTIWTLYLLDAPQPAPWSGRVPVALADDPLRLPPEGGSDDGPRASWVQPRDKMRLPQGSAASQILWGIVRMHGPHDDPGGRARREALIEAFNDRAREVPALQVLIPPTAQKSGGTGKGTGKGKGKDKDDDGDEEKRNNSVKNQRYATPPGDKKEPKHRGRIQVQGGGVEKSRKWAQESPRARSQGLEDLESLKKDLSRSQLRERTQAFEKAARFISATTYTAPPDLHRSFRNDEVIARRGSERVDVEILDGTAFV